MKGAQPSPFSIGSLLASGVHKLHVCSQSSLNKVEQWPLLLASILIRVVGKGGHTGSVSDSDTWAGVRQGSSWLTQFHYQTLQVVAEPVLKGGRGRRDEIKSNVLYDSYMYIHIHMYLMSSMTAIYTYICTCVPTCISCNYCCSLYTPECMQ